MTDYFMHGKSTRLLIMFMLLISAGEALAASGVQNYKVHQPFYNFDFEVYKADDVPNTWFKTYDGYFVTMGSDLNWVYGKQSGQRIVKTGILVGSVDPAGVEELKLPLQEQITIPDEAPGGSPVTVHEPELLSGEQALSPESPAEPPRVFDFDSPEPEFTQERAWDEIPWTIPPEDKMEFAERIYTTVKDALSSRRNSYLLYGEPLNVSKAWHPSNLFKEVPFPGDWGENIVWANDKRGILWWAKWHIFGVSTYGSKVLGAWILDSGYGYNNTKIPMEDFWRWYDGRILLFNHFFKKEPVYDDEMAIWLLNGRYLFILVPNIVVSAEGRGDIDKMSQFFDPLEWVVQPFALFEWVRWSLGWRPTDKHLLYYLVRLSEVPDEVTLNQTIRALWAPMKPGDINDAGVMENVEAAEKAQMRRKLQRQEQE